MTHCSPLGPESPFGPGSPAEPLSPLAPTGPTGPGIPESPTGPGKPIETKEMDPKLVLGSGGTNIYRMKSAEFLQGSAEHGLPTVTHPGPVVTHKMKTSVPTKRK